MPLKILIIPPSYFASNRTVGGGERYALALAQALAGRIDVTLGLFDLGSAVQNQDGLKRVIFPVTRLDQTRGFPISRQAAVQLRDYDLIHIFVFPTPLADWFLLRSRWRRQKIILTDVGGSGACWSSRLRMIHPKLDLNRWADGLAHLSQYAAAFYKDWRQTQTILYGGADLKWFKPSGEPSNGYALFVGRLLPHKGILELIQSMPPDRELRVAGRPYDGDYFQALHRAAVGKRVSFYTDTAEEELLRLYQQALFVAQPSLPASGGEDKSELLGLVAIEAMACGKPVLVTRTGSLPELVRDEIGFSVPSDRLDLWRERITWFFGHPAEAAKMGIRARLHVEKHLNWASTAERAQRLYKEVSGKE